MWISTLSQFADRLGTIARHGCLSAACVLLQFLATCPVAAQVGLHGIIAPERPFLETRLHSKVLNFDILLANESATSYRLVAVRLKAFDKGGKLEVSRQINENGKPAAIALMGKLTLAPGERIDYFQPFTEFADIFNLDRIQVEMLFVETGERASPIPQQADVRLTFNVFPRYYSPAPYVLPMRGTVLVQDGHDLYSHHRRHALPFAASAEKAFSPNLYAYDFVRVGPDGETVHGDARFKSNWLTYGEPVVAPAPGVIVRAVNDVPENSFDSNGEAVVPASAEASDPDGFGNSVVIRHSDGRYTWLLHLLAGSVTVREGQRVRAGQQLGRVGFSGDSLFPHLHFTVTDSSAYPSHGMPSYFKSFVRVVGAKRIETGGQIDTGDIVQALSK